MKNTLSPREAAILWCIGQGLQKQEIAKALGISTGTVRTHVQNILTKLGAHSQAEAVRISMERGTKMAAPEGEDIENVPGDKVAIGAPLVPPVTRRVHVVRVIELVGTAEWVESTLSQSLVSKGHDFRAFNGTIRELAREELQS